MRICRIAIENFANFDSVDFETDESIVIVGENKVGRATCCERCASCWTRVSQTGSVNLAWNISGMAWGTSSVPKFPSRSTSPTSMTTMICLPYSAIFD